MPSSVSSFCSEFHTATLHLSIGPRHWPPQLPYSNEELVRILIFALCLKNWSSTRFDFCVVFGLLISAVLKILSELIFNLLILNWLRSLRCTSVLRNHIKNHFCLVSHFACNLHNSYFIHANGTMIFLTWFIHMGIFFIFSKNWWSTKLATFYYFV